MKKASFPYIQRLKGENAGMIQKVDGIKQDGNTFYLVLNNGTDQLDASLYGEYYIHLANRDDAIMNIAEILASGDRSKLPNPPVQFTAPEPNVNFDQYADLEEDVSHLSTQHNSNQSTNATNAMIAFVDNTNPVNTNESISVRTSTLTDIIPYGEIEENPIVELMKRDELVKKKVSIQLELTLPSKDGYMAMKQFFKEDCDPLIARYIINDLGEPNSSDIRNAIAVALEKHCARTSRKKSNA